MYDLGSFSYLALYHKDAKKLQTDTGETYNWKWRMPTNLQARKAPVAFLSVCSAYTDDSGGGVAGVPHMLRLRIPTDNYFSSEIEGCPAPYIVYPIVAQLIRDAPAGHWYAQAESNPIIQIPSGLQTLEFDMVDGNGNIIAIDSAAPETLNIILKLYYPPHNEVRDNTLMSYAQSEIGNPPFNRL